MNKRVLMNIQSPDEAPTLDAVKRRYGLADDEIDAEFGVIAIDPEKHMYSVLVNEEAAGKVEPGTDWKTDGPYSNPRIMFGPPQ